MDRVGDGETGAEEEDDVPGKLLAVLPVHELFSGFVLAGNEEEESRHHHL